MLPSAAPPVSEPSGTAADAFAPPLWLRRQSGADVDAWRNLVLACVFGTAFLLSTAGLVVVANGRTIRPFILQAQGDGSVVPVGARLLPYRPGAPERRYFLAQWVRHLLALDARLSEAWLAEAWQLTRGKATVEFTDWLHATAPLQHLKDDPSLTRSVEILGISLVDDDVALVRVACEERSLGRPNAQRRKRLLTIHFQTSAPESEDAALRNPIGLLVTDFQVGEDLER